MFETSPTAGLDIMFSLTHYSSELAWKLIEGGQRKDGSLIRGAFALACEFGGVYVRSSFQIAMVAA